MRRVKKILITVLVLTCLTGTYVSADGGSEFVAGESDVSVDIMRGNYDLITHAAKPFGELEIRRSIDTHTTGFEDSFTIDDLRGVDDGWSLSVTSSSLQSSDADHHMFDNVLSIKAPERIVRLDESGVEGLPKATYSGVRVLNGEAVTVLESNGYGDGAFDVIFAEDALQLTIGSQFKEGNYTAVLDWTLQSVPYEPGSGD